MSLLKFAFGLGVENAASSSLVTSAPKPMPKLDVKSPIKIKELINPVQEGTASSLLQQTINHTHKLGLDQSKSCTTCKKEQHYGPCKLERLSTNGAGTPFIRTRMRTAGFNMGMHGSDNDTTDELSYQHVHSQAPYQERLKKLLVPLVQQQAQPEETVGDTQDALRKFFNASNATGNDEPMTSPKLLS